MIQKSREKSIKDLGFKLDLNKLDDPMSKTTPSGFTVKFGLNGVMESTFSERAETTNRAS